MGELLIEEALLARRVGLGRGKGASSCPPPERVKVLKDGLKGDVLAAKRLRVDAGPHLFFGDAVLLRSGGDVRVRFFGTLDAESDEPGVEAKVIDHGM